MVLSDIHISFLSVSLVSFSSFSDVFGCGCSLFLLLLSLLSFVLKTFNPPSDNACLGLRLFVCLLWGFRGEFLCLRLFVYLFVVGI